MLKIQVKKINVNGFGILKEILKLFNEKIKISNYN